MFTLLIVLIAIIGLLLTVVILLQSGKGGGLAGIAAGGATQQILGARTAPDVLEKSTWTLGALFIILCIMTNFTIDRSAGGGESVIQQQAGEAGADEVPVLPPVQDPGAAQPSEAQPTPDGQ